MLYRHKTKASKPFQLTAARRRLDSDQATPLSEVTVSTHSRPKAAGTFITDSKGRLIVSTHSRPKAAGQALEYARDIDCVSTHSRPKAAGQITIAQFEFKTFQLTAARRRLVKSGYVGS